jgi:hypothetical protein
VGTAVGPATDDDDDDEEEDVDVEDGDDAPRDSTTDPNPISATTTTITAIMSRGARFFRWGGGACEAVVMRASYPGSTVAP